MSPTSALFIGLTGLNANARKLDIIGNNIANINTVAFKSSRMMFETMFQTNLGFGTSPTATSGGVNPMQIGNGVGIGAIQRNFNNGTINSTGDLRDLAIDGSGFFMVENNGSTFYTRAGTFRQDIEDNLTTATGERLLGYAIDDNFNLITGNLVPLNIPVGRMTIAEATRNVSLVGNLNKSGDIPTTGSIIDLMGSTTSGPTILGGGFITSTTLLTTIDDPNNPGTAQFSSGQTIRLKDNATKGGGSVAQADLEITATTSVQDLMNFLDLTLGIQTTGTPNPDGSTPGVTVDPSTGVIRIVGNVGTENNIAILTGDLQIIDSDGITSLGAAFETAQIAEADGESVRTTISAFDSLGTSVLVDVVMVLDSTPNTGPVWRYFIESNDDTDLDISVATGTLQFDNEGQIDTIANTVKIAIDRQDTGAGTPLTFNLNFLSDTGQTTSLSTGSSLIGLTTDGLPPGTLENFATGNDGTIMGRFSNGAIRVMGQVVLAKFSNPAGLIDMGGNLFSTGPNSGPGAVAAPGQLGLGSVVSGALESSNVDLGAEFTQMILTSTGYSASSRVIRTADELLQQLLVLGR
ncbi:MAG: flagellar hook-basal body complex protein [Phycisphaerales bacterium]|nr:flagellar hook-basal body complex protein [Phycisphaerales bacterium]